MKPIAKLLDTFAVHTFSNQDTINTNSTSVFVVLIVNNIVYLNLK